MSFWAGESGDLRKWQVLDPRLMHRLYTFYENDIDIKIAENVLLSAIFKGGFTIEYGGTSSEPSYANTIQAKLKSGGKNGNGNAPTTNGNRTKGGSSLAPQDPVLIAWLSKLAMEGFRMKMIFGMCPFRMIFDEDIDSEVIIIPEMASGLFVYQLDKYDVVKVGWMSTTRKGRNNAEIKPDKDTGVYVWPSTVPTMIGNQPFKSVAARLGRHYLIRDRVVQNFLVADQMASRPPIVTQSKENPRDIEHMSYDEILGESVLFGEDDQTVENLDRIRIDSSAVSRQSRLNEHSGHGGGGDGSLSVYGPRRTQVDMFGLEFEVDNVSPWLRNVYPITSGRTTANIAIPRPRADIDKWNKEWSELAHKAFGVPVEQAGAGKKTSAEALSTDSRFRTSVSMGRDDVKTFVEEAWAQSMTESENMDMRLAISGIDKRRSSLMDKRKTDPEDVTTEGQVLSLAEQAAIKGDPFVGGKARTGAPPGGGNPIPSASSTSGARMPNVRSAMMGGASSKSRRLNIDPVNVELEADEIEKQYKQQRRLRQDPLIQSDREVEASRLQSTSAILSEKEIERILKIASLREIEVDPLNVQGEVNGRMFDGAQGELQRLDSRESQLRKALIQRNRLVLHWDAPLIEMADIILLKNEGLIDEDTARVLTDTFYGFPYDTPAGENKEDHAMDLKQKGEMEKIKEQNKARTQTAKISAAARGQQPIANARGPPSEGGPSKPVASKSKASPSGGGKRQRKEKPSSGNKKAK